jgi:hypothetical protein
MSAALQLPVVWGAAASPSFWSAQEMDPVWSEEEEELLGSPQFDLAEDIQEEAQQKGPSVSLAFYRKHTESLLRRYLYVSMQVGRTPSVMHEPMERGNVSCRRLRTFEDAVVFVLDVEACLGKLSALERLILNRIVLQEYTQSETAALLGMSSRAVSYKLPIALDRMTETLLEYGLLQFSY